MVSGAVRQAPGDTKSGDNDALKAMLDEERAHGRHVGIAPQCSFNSYVWRSRVRDWWRLVYMPNTILLGLYRPGALLWVLWVQQGPHLTRTFEASIESSTKCVAPSATFMLPLRRRLHPSSGWYR